MKDNIKIHVLHCGKVCVDPALPFKEKSWNPIAFTGIGRSWKKRLWLPVSAYLIEHPKGLILLDTGWHREISPNGEYSKKDQIKHMSFPHYFLNQGVIPHDQAINEQLSKMGIKISDLDYVLLSHMHTDHASGLKLVKDAKNILLSDLELEDTKKHSVRYASSMWDGVPLSTFSFENSGIGPVGKSYDLFNDGSILLINIPGHTNGLFATLVKKEEKYVLIYSDGGYAKKSWKDMIAPGTSLDSKLAYNSLKWIREMSLNENCIESLANHDSDIIPHIIEL